MTNSLDTNTQSSFLEEFGLNPTESQIYISLLKSGGGTIGDVYKETGTKRTTAYSSIEGLIRKGLARYEEFGFKRKIIPENPQRLAAILKEKSTKLEKQLPILESIFNEPGAESYIKYYKGVNSIKRVYEDMLSNLRPNDDYFVFSNTELWSKDDPEFYLDFSLKRSKKALNLRIILEDNETGRKYFQMKSALAAEIKFLPKGVSIKTNTVVTPHKMLIHQLIKPPVAYILENKSFISTQTEMFKLLWNSLPDVEDNKYRNN